MKKINGLTFAFSFAGFFLGAGYVSGQELWQFFGSFGKLGILGIALAATLLAVFGIIVIMLVQKTGKSEIGEVIIMWDAPILKIIFVFLEIFFLFGIYVIMTAGVSALFNQLFGFSPFIGSLIFVVLVTAVASAGLNGMTAAFSITVPALVIASIVIFLICTFEKGLSNFCFTYSTNENALISNWFVSSIVFVSYNLFSSIGILSPYGKIITNKRTVIIGTILGSVILFLIAIGIILSLSTSPESIKNELPMLSLATSISTIASYIFAFLLLSGMFGTSISSVFAINEYAKIKFKLSKRRTVMLIISLSLLAFIFSLFGFGELIGIVYPICGYLGIIALILIVIHFIKVIIISKKS